MKYYQFVFEELTEEKISILIALLNDIGFTGFEETDDSLKAFIKRDDLNEDLFDSVISTAAINFSRSVIEEINWNEKWEAGFEPVNILYPETSNPFVHLRAYFHAACKDAKHDIVITPKMSFGTGHHATTHLMIEQMSRINFENKKVIDFGTGTGVLAILAEKMGATNIIAIDNDDWSINNAGENIIANHCNRISLQKAETISVSDKAAVILANINLHIIVHNIAAINHAAETGAMILFSGMLLQDEPIITAALKTANIDLMEVFYKNGWIAVLAKI